MGYSPRAREPWPWATRADGLSLVWGPGLGIRGMTLSVFNSGSSPHNIGSMECESSFCMKTSTRNEIKGAGRELQGRAKELAGKVTRSARLQAEGKIEKNAGKIQRKVGELEKDIEEESEE